jgi:hypothetical protein
MIELVITSILGAATRIWKGTGKWRKPVHPTYVVVLIALTSAYFALQNFWAIPVAAVASLSVTLAVSKFIEEGWGSWWMGLRYSIPALVIVIPGWFGLYPLYHHGLVYLAATVFAGLSYPVFLRLFGDKYHHTRISEGLVGASVLNLFLL